MRSRLIKIAVVTALAVLPLFSAARGVTASSRTQTVVQSRVGVAPDYEARLTTSINAVRKRYGLRCLRLVPELVRSSDSHSLQMARGGFFAHESQNGASFSARIQRYYRSRGYRYWAAAENILWAGQSIGPNQVVRRWLGSPGHRTILLSPEWTVMGVGVARTPHGPGVFRGHAVLVITVDFAVRR